MHLFSYNVAQVPSYCNYGPYAEYTKYNLAIIACNLHTKGHTIVLCKMNNKPGCNLVFLAKGKVGFNINLNPLVNKKNQENDKQGLFHATLQKFGKDRLYPSALCYALYCCSILASMLSVAWGTLLKRSLGISLPVTLQMP